MVERATFIDMTNKFFQLNQANNLPARHPIPHLDDMPVNKENTIVVESEELNDATIELGRDLFGDALKIE